MFRKKITPAERGDRAVLRARSLDGAEGRDLLRQLQGLAAAGVSSFSLDLSAIPALNSLQAAWLFRIREEARRGGLELKIEGEDRCVREFLQMVTPGMRPPTPPVPPERNPVVRAGGAVLNVVREAGQVWNIIADAIYWSFIAPFSGGGIRVRALIDEIHEMGIKAVPIVVTLNLLLGLVIAMLSAAQLELFGVQIWVASLVVIGFARELAVLLTGIVVSARTGSAIAAELATMKVSEEIDALRGMGLSVGKFLIAPKVMAILLCMPILTGIGFVSGVLGGFILGVFALGYNIDQWWLKTLSSARLQDLSQGLIKSFVFAVLIVVIGCHNGLRVTGGARGVGMGTTRAVVMDIFAIIVADMFFATLFYIIL